MQGAAHPPARPAPQGRHRPYQRVLLLGGTSEIGQEILAALRLPPDALAGHAATVWVPAQLGPLAAAFRLVPRPIWRRLRR
jgi:hypothetical protein